MAIHLASFAQRLIDWHMRHGRHDLPWQQGSKTTPNPYEVWVSEVMLQQTQVATVIHYFERFMASFPTVAELAAAEWEQVAAHWAGLGYYARARNLHKAAGIICNQFDGNFPKTLDGWQALPGIGRSTAGAVRAMGQGACGTILDGNVKRVLTRHQAVTGDITKAATLKQLWQLAEHLTPAQKSGTYAQAIMDLGATLCTRKNPSCGSCPVQTDCQAYAQGKPESYPVKPKRKAKPTKTAHVLVLEKNLGNSTTWFWAQRPQSGLWGGLWCLPIYQDIPTALSTILPQPVNTNASTTPIKHTFTHFHWLLSPVVYKLSSEQATHLDELAKDRSELAGQWLTHTQIQQKGTPRAMDKVLKQLVSTSSIKQQ